MRYWSSNLLPRLVGYFLLISLFTVALVIGTAHHLVRESLRESVFDRLEGVIDNKAEQIIHWAHTQRREILTLAASPAVKTKTEDLEAPGRETPTAAYKTLHGLFQAVVINKPDLRDIYLMSTQGGKVLLSTDRSSEEEYRVNDEAFRFGRWSTYIQNVHPSPQDLDPIMTVATPLLSASGQRLGVLAADLDLERMDSIILKRTGLGRTGEAYLVDRFNVFVSASRFGRGEFLRGVHSPGIKAAVAGGSGLGLYRNYEGVPVIGVYRWLDQLSLALLVEMHQKEAFRPAVRLAWILVLVGVGSILLMVAGVYLLARRIARPILAISEAASHLASGDLTARAPVQTEDEIGLLARSFNQMAARLDRLYQGQEEKVNQLEEIEQALRQSEQYYRDFFENDLTGDFVADARGAILSYNPALARILGFEDEPGEEAPRLDRFMPTAKALDDFLDLLIREERLDYHQMVMQRLDGRPVHVVANFMALQNEDGSLREIKGYLFDETKRLELEEQLRHSQKMEALGRLAGGVAHDFNNLMTAVTGYSDLTLAKLEPGHPLRPGIEQIAQAGERAAALTRQLLVFSRRQVLKPKIVDLNQVVAETEGMIRRLVWENIEIVTKLDPDLGRIRADDGQIQQVIMNLVINARDAMPEGGLLTIETKNNASGRVPDDRPEDPPGPGFVRLSISDTGVGMAPEIQTKVFDPFFTTKEPGKGTGLGLATVHGVIQQSGGRILIDSEPDCGSTFHVILPRADGRFEPKQVLPALLPETGDQATILLVEDEEAVRDLTEEILELSGYEVITAADGQEALALEEKDRERVELLLTDVVMPGLSGPELALQLRREKPDLKVLFISGYTDQDLWGGKLEKKGSGFIPKPFKPAELVLKIQQLLEERD